MLLICGEGASEGATWHPFITLGCQKADSHLPLAARHTEGQQLESRGDLHQPKASPDPGHTHVWLCITQTQQPRIDPKSRDSHIHIHQLTSILIIDCFCAELRMWPRTPKLIKICYRGRRTAVVVYGPAG